NWPWPTMTCISRPMPESDNNSWMSSRRHALPLISYSLAPSRNIRRVIDTSVYSMGNAPSELSMVSVTSARPNGARPEVPAKMTSSILPPRRSLAPWVPMTHRSASSTFDLPDPLGPTTQVMPGSKRRVVADAKDLKPLSVKLFKCTRRGPFPYRLLSSRSAEASSDRMMLPLAQVRNVVGGPRRGTGDIRLDIRSRLGVGTAPCPFSVDSSTRRLADPSARRLAVTRRFQRVPAAWLNARRTPSDCPWVPTTAPPRGPSDRVYFRNEARPTGVRTRPSAPLRRPPPGRRPGSSPCPPGPVPTPDYVSTSENRPPGPDRAPTPSAAPPQCHGSRYPHRHRAAARWR